jgi:WD40 repeat protein/tRNA A-37 threonylcarbamoyl transferase component Bud32
MTARPRNSVSQDRRLAEVIAAYVQAAEAGQAPDRAEWLGRYPELAAELAEFFADQDQFDRVMSPLRASPRTTCFPTASPAPSADPATPDGHSFGDYELVEEIARGGMGIVFKARNVRLNRTVALKMILAGHLATAAEVQRFCTEAENAAQLDHPRIVPIYEVGEHQGYHFFTMKLVEGGNLADHLGRFARDPKAAAELMKGVARAVHYAHQRGILHRDLKPANILIDASGQPHVTDFGLAKRLAGEGGLPSSSAVVGTPSYMAPEQASGKKVLSTAIDVFSMGAILYELLTGRSPFRADTPFGTLLQVMQKEPTRPSALNRRVDRDLETICVKCLAKEPERRYGSAEALADDLERWLAGQPIQARRVGIAERLIKWARRRKSIAALLAVSGLAIVSLVVILAISNVVVSRQKAETDRALKKYKEALHDEQLALKEARQTSYYQTIALAAPEVLTNNVRRADQLLDNCPEEFRHWEWNALKRLCHGENRSLAFATEPAAAAFSPDGSRLAAAGGMLGGPGFVTIWDAATGSEVRSFRGHEDAIKSLVYSPDGRRLATASRDRTVRLWNALTGQEVLVLRGHTLGVSCVAFSSDGRWIASASEDRTVKVWDAASGSQRWTFSGHTAAVWSVGFNPEATTLASAGSDHTIRLWNLASGIAGRTFHGHTGIVHGVVFSPDGQLVASASYDGTARLWNVATGRELVVFRGHSRFVTSVAFSPDGRYVASASIDRTVTIWQAASGEVALVLRGHGGGVWGVAFRREDWRIASVGEDRAVKLWDAPALAMTSALHAGPEPVRMAALSGDGRRLAVLRGRSLLEVWDPLTARRILSHSAGNQALEQLSLSSDGTLVAIAGEKGFEKGVRVLKVDTLTETWSLASLAIPVAGLALSADARRLAIILRDQSVSIWDMTSGERVSVLQDGSNPLPGEMPPIPTALFDADGSRLALAVDDPRDRGRRELTVLDTANGRTLFAIRGVAAPMAFSRGGLLIATAPDPDASEARVYDAADGRMVARLRGHTGPIRALAVSPDGARIASASQDGTVKIWDTSPGRELLTLPGSARPLEDLQFSADGSHLVGADDEGTIKIWDATPRRDVQPRAADH